MANKAWTEPDQMVALYLARRGPDASIENGFISRTGHGKKSLKMAISNFRYLLGLGGLSNVSARQRKICAEFGTVPVGQLQKMVMAYITAAASEKADSPMPTSSSGRRLTEAELQVARGILNDTRKAIERAAGTDQALLWAMRRKVYKELVYDERSKPMARRILKMKLFVRQKGLCPGCGNHLPERYSVLDRREAMKGYTAENCRLLCPDCDRKEQERRKYA